MVRKPRVLSIVCHAKTTAVDARRRQASDKPLAGPGGQQWLVHPRAGEPKSASAVTIGELSR